MGTGTEDRPIDGRGTAAPPAPAEPAGDPPVADRGPGAAGAGPEARLRRLGRLGAAAGVVALAVSTVVVGALSLVGDTWVPLSDWASLSLRVEQVGGADTPLVGPYSFHGFAHPGPLLFWLAAPAYRLSGGDPRSLLWVGAAVNVAAVVALAALAWRRGRCPLLLGAMAFVALLVRGLGPTVVVDLWGPYVPLLPFLLALALVADAALGHRRSLVWAVVPASFALQSHLAFAPLLAAAGLWCVVWSRADGPGGRGDAWRPVLRPAALLAAVLWVGPLVDAVAGLHNPVRVARSLVHGRDHVGLVGGVELVGGYVRPDGYWWRGGESPSAVPARAADALAVVLLGLLLAGCAVVARRRGRRDAAALATLALTLLAATVVAAGRLVTPTHAYLAEWVKVVAGLAWFAVAWTAWRVLGAGAAGARRPAAAVAVAAVALAAGSTWGDAAAMPLPPGDTAGVAAELRAVAAAELSPGRTYRVEVAGDSGVHDSGLILALVEAGATVVTDDGEAGQKWGRSHRWAPGDEVDATLTLVGATHGAPSPEADACAADPAARLLYASEGLRPDEAALLDDLGWRTLTDPGSITDADHDRRQSLVARSHRVLVYEAPEPCATDRRDRGGGQ